MDLIPGFYCGTAEAVYPVSYCDLPNTRILSAGRFAFELQSLKPGKRIYGEFNQEDSYVWERIPYRLKND
jgi:hypothetical protein